MSNANRHFFAGILLTGIMLYMVDPAIVHLPADLLTRGIVYGLAAALIIVIAVRLVKNERRWRAQVDSTLYELEQRIDELDRKLKNKRKPNQDAV